MAERTLRAGAVAIALVVLLGTTGCTVMTRNHGFMPKEEVVATVEPGSDTRETVIEKLGPPAAGGMLQDGGLYYVSYSFKEFGAFTPKETDRQVLAITFDDRGIVRNIERFGAEQGRVVSLSRRVTDNGVRDNLLLRQILGSIGRVNAADLFGSD